MIFTSPSTVVVTALVALMVALCTCYVGREHGATALVTSGRQQRCPIAYALPAC